jgi:hypothetical protein
MIGAGMAACCVVTSFLPPQPFVPAEAGTQRFLDSASRK